MPSVLAPWGFDDLDEAVYRAVLRRPGVTVDVLATELVRPVEEVRGSARKLIRGRLIRRRGDGVTALRPDVALTSIFLEAESEITRRREELDRIGETLGQFMHDHALGQQDRGVPPAAEVVVGLDRVDRVVAQLVADNDAEVLGVVGGPPVGTPADQVGRCLPRAAALDAAARGLGARCLFSAAALDHPQCAAVATELARAGVAVRIGRRLPLRLVLFRGRAAVVPAEAESPDGDAVLAVRGSALLGVLTRTFDLLWERSVPLGRVDEDGGGDAALLRLLAGGGQDEAVARELGVSVRTVRRRVAELLERLGARTRFQAGVQAARKGLL